MYNLKAAPDELVNCYDNPAFKEIIAELQAIACAGWNTQELTQQVLLSQKQRNFIANIPGDAPGWEQVARIGDDERFVRKDGVDATKGRLRLPCVLAVPPDWPELDLEYGRGFDARQVCNE